MDAEQVPGGSRLMGGTKRSEIKSEDGRAQAQWTAEGNLGWIPRGQETSEEF